MCIYIYKYIEREREYVFSIIGPSCSFLYKLISSTPPGGGLQSCRESIILPDTPFCGSPRDSHLGCLSGGEVVLRLSAIGCYRDSSLKLPRVSMDNLLGLASCMISPKALVAALRTWFQDGWLQKWFQDLFHVKYILFPWKYSISIEIFLWYWWWWSYDVHSPIFRVRKPSALHSGGEISDGSRHNTPVASWGHLFWWPSGVDVLLDLVCESSKSGCWPIRLPVLKYQTMTTY